jgi:coenzyme PQQ synthesis protein D (PqqD)
MATPNAKDAIGTNSIVVAAKDQVSSDLAGEAIVLSLQSGLYYGLGDVAGRIWGMVREPIRVSAIRDAILQDYDVDAAQCEADVLDFLRQLAAEGMIEVKDAAEGA